MFIIDFEIFFVVVEVETVIGFYCSKFKERGRADLEDTQQIEIEIEDSIQVQINWV